MNEFDIKSEWTLLQNQFDSYEKHSLYIKLCSVLVLLFSEIYNVASIGLMLLLLVLWLQDSIWKTYQSRIESRLFTVEKSISNKLVEGAFQFNSDFQKNRSGSFALIKEYLQQSLRPTVAFPHVVILMILITKYTLSLAD